MPRSLFKDESGMTMGLVVITIVLIGVMGAGLLTFVQRDIETVVEVNRGHKALEMAETGLQEARRQLIADPVRQHYDRRNDNDCVAPRQRKGDDWSPLENSQNCGKGVDSGPGVTRSFDGGRFQVTIECLSVPEGPRLSGGPSEAGENPFDPGAACADASTAPPNLGVAPESVDPRRRSFFKVVSTGLYPNENGAKRRVEAVVVRESRPLPLGYYTPKNIELSGTVEVRGVSFFAGGDISGVGGSSTTIGPEPDLLLGNWATNNPNNPYLPASSFNTVPRGSTAAGFAAAGRVCEGTSAVGCKGPPAGTSFFDSTPAGGRPRLIPKADPEAANAPGTISYPFDAAARPDMELLMEEAAGLGTYYTPSGGSFSIDKAVLDKALSGTSNPVIFVDFQGAASTGSNVRYDTDSDNASTPVVIVVRNGNFDFAGRNGKTDGDSDGEAEFRGAIIVEGDGSTTGTYKAAGNSELAGFVFADGNISLTGNAQAESLLSPDDSGNVAPPDFFDRMLAFNRIRLWNWQEVYE